MNKITKYFLFSISTCSVFILFFCVRQCGLTMSPRISLSTAFRLRSHVNEEIKESLIENANKNEEDKKKPLCPLNYISSIKRIACRLWRVSKRQTIFVLARTSTV